jgi:hypothetical protein
MIVLFTDYGIHDPYVGQLKVRLALEAPTQLVVDLLHAAPDFNAHAGAHLLAAFAPTFPSGSVFVAVVDPGVGTARSGVVVMAGGRWFVAPDNGLTSVLAARHADSKVWRIDWLPDTVSSTFHGRDVFAVIAAEIARGEFPASKLAERESLEVAFDAGDLTRVIYIDHFGNAFTGIRAQGLPVTSRVIANHSEFIHAETFGLCAKGTGFWFSNSVGLLELAVNRGHAASQFGLVVGTQVHVQKPH